MTSFRIHPSIGFARVGTSDEYYLAPETPASLPIPGNQAVAGGLPIRPGTDSDTITSSDLRDDQGALKRQAARFRIFAYESGEETYPNGQGSEVTIGSVVGGRTVTNILWQAHVANKKANSFQLEYPSSGDKSVIANYESGLPPNRNPKEGDPTSAERIRRLVIDPGPRTIEGTATDKVSFDVETPASYLSHRSGLSTTIESLPDYPKSFPADAFETLYCPAGDIDTLGDLETDDQGRLLVVAAYGRACAWFQPDGDPHPLDVDVDNDGWFDDTADGPVSATLIFEDGGTEDVAGAWVVATDPAYAPQTINVVSLWDDIFDTWVRKLTLMPEVFDGSYKEDFHPSFLDHVKPFFVAAAVQEFNTYLPEIARTAHRAVGEIAGGTAPDETILSGLAYIRNPNNPAEVEIGVPLMPLSLGDSGEPFLAPTYTQYFFLEQWSAGRYEEGSGPALGPGELMDMASLFNCLGGRFSPGIDMTFIVRQPDLWRTDWQTNGGGPFRIRSRSLDYGEATANEPFLTRGYVPVHQNEEGLEPGDTSKFMAIPWHTDYNSCATHPTEPNPANSTTLFWSWPAQRPVSVYVASEVEGGTLPPQRYSVRGPGTSSGNPQNMGRYQERIEMVINWPKIGTVIQGSAIAPEDGGPFSDEGAEWLLEVQSQLEQLATEPDAEPWPLNATSGTQ